MAELTQRPSSLAAWPTASPSLADIPNRSSGEWWNANFEGQEAQAILDALGDQWRDRSFLEGSQAYRVELFPLVPPEVLPQGERYARAYSYPMTPTIELQCPAR